MDIAVLGAGAMGSVFGARLARGGARVTLLDVNQAHLDAVNEGGLRVELDDGAHRLDLPAMRPEMFEGPADLVLLFTKIFHTDAALTAIAPVLETATVLGLQNGIGNAERIARHVPSERVLIGMTMTPADFMGPGRVASHGPATTAYFAVDGVARQILEELHALLVAGGVDAKIDPDIQVAIWEKAAFNCAMNAVCALTDATPGAIGVSEPGRALAIRVAREAIAVANAKGLAAVASRVEALIAQACAHHLTHEPSMLQDRKAGRRTEIDALNGAVAELGQAMGVPVPGNQVLADLIRLSETAQNYRANFTAP